MFHLALSPQFLAYLLSFFLMFSTATCKFNNSRKDLSPAGTAESPSAARGQVGAEGLENYTFVDPSLLQGITRYAVVKDPRFALSDDDTTIETIGIVVGSLAGAGGLGYAAKQFLSSGSPSPEFKGELAAKPKLVVPEVFPTGKVSDILRKQAVIDNPLQAVKKSDVGADLPDIGKNFRQVVLASSTHKLDFEANEEALMVVLKSSDQLVTNLKSAKNRRIINGTTEYRLVSVSQKTNEAVVVAIDLRPRVDLAAISKNVDARRVVIPLINFRDDELFAIKTKIAEALANKPVLTLESKGTLNLGGSSQVSYKVMGELGKGTYGQVLRVQFNPQGMAPIELAIKQPVADMLSSPVNANDKESLIQEVGFLQAMARHPHSMQFYGAFPMGGKGHYGMVMEVLDGDWSKISAKNSNPQRYFISAADGYAAMHAASLVHYDIKSNNIFIKGEESKLGDFGFSRTVDPRILPGIGSQGTIRSQHLLNRTKDAPGNPFAEDVFAYGFTMADIRLGNGGGWSTIEKCCTTRDSTSHFVVNGEAFFNAISGSLVAKNLPPAEVALIKRMLSNDPTKRPTMAEVARELRGIYKMNDM